jgi:hypothetical protein
MEQDNKVEESPWWRPTSQVGIAIDHTYSPFAGVVHWITVSNGTEQHKFVAEGIFWEVADRRIKRKTAPGVGEWEQVGAPGEPVVDWSDLGKLLDDGNPPAGQHDAIDDETGQ